MTLNENPCLLPAVRELVEAESKNFRNGEYHSLLWLDKYSCTPAKGERKKDQETAEDEKQRYLQRVIEANNSRRALPATAVHLRHELESYAQSNGGCSWDQQLSSPMSLHLARATAMENVGLCLHPTYGFAYMPGTGVKGIARAYAETVWLPKQANLSEAWRDIERVFGWGRTKDRKVRLSAFPQLAKENPRKEHAGSVVFHDAWPASNEAPELMMDIVNSHHQKYYSQIKDKEYAPGDWEDPIPSNFLAVEAGERFLFMLSQRASGNGKLFKLACDWLQQGLVLLGAGAKTNAGYGRFVGSKTDTERVGWQTVRNSRVQLQTSALLAGALQKKEDCDLRASSIRGQLRWWWRTLHAAHLGSKELLRLESLVWGNTKKGGSVRVEVDRDGRNDPKSGQRSGKNVVDMLRLNRWHLEPPAQWSLRIFFNPRAVTGKSELRDLVFQQINDTVTLWERFSGLGFRTRKGFGSFIMRDNTDHSMEEFSREELISRAAAFRQETKADLRNGGTGTPAIETLSDREFETQWRDSWSALRKVWQAFHKLYKDDQEAMLALGTGKSGIPLHKTANRYPAPFFIKLVLNEKGTYTVRLSAMADAHLRPKDEVSNWHEEKMPELFDAFFEHLNGTAEQVDNGTIPSGLDGFQEAYEPAAPRINRQLSPEELNAKAFENFRRYHPAITYHAERKQNHNTLMKALENLKTSGDIASLAVEYLQAIYPKGEIRKKAKKKKDKLFQYLKEQSEGTT